MSLIFLFSFCFLAVLFSLLIIIVRNPIHSILYLILVFCCVSVVLLILGLEFTAIIFLIVYVGAIAVLFLFVVMMLNIKIIELDEGFWRSVPAGLLVAALFFISIISLFPLEFFMGIKLNSILIYDTTSRVSVEPIFYRFSSSNSFIHDFSFTNSSLLG
jgi:NADH:ubiquinone oxidoreductase subunit 6 (subunit J)